MQVAAGCLLERVEEVDQLRVAVRVRCEVVLDAFEERVCANPDHELLEGRRSFVVGDRVEVERQGLDVGDVGDDRMSGRQLVLRARAGFGRHREVRPGHIEARRLRDAQVSHVLGEALVEPHVVPPSRADQVTEPHVCHLVQGGLRALHALRLGRPGAEDHPLVVDDASDVLHRARREFGHVDLVVLSKRIPMAEAALEEVESLPRDLEDLVGVEVFEERLPAVEPEGYAPVVLVHRSVLAGHDGRDVGRHHARFRKAPHSALAFNTGSVRDDDPVLRRLDSEGESRFQVGLVEAWIAAVRGVLGELAVQIDATVHRILEPADPGAVARKRSPALNSQ